MRKMLLSGALALLTALGVNAQGYRLVFTGDPVPEASQPVLRQRIQQMLDAFSLSLTEEEDAPTLEVAATVTSRMETPGSLSQTALTIDLSLSAKGAKEVFSLKGVGANEADAWTRAAKMFLPRSKAAQSFAETLK